MAALMMGGFLGGCATVAQVTDLTVLPAAAAEYAAAGSSRYTVIRGDFRGPSGCLTRFETYRPDEPKTSTMVFLSHGFLRDLTSMRGWGKHWASHGVPVTVMSTCNSTWFNGRHDRNAADIRALAGDLHEGAVLYAGFSSGGLAALLAAAADVRAAGYLGLDAVDTDGLAAGRAPAVAFPTLFILGEPSPCNARSNIETAVSAIEGARAVRVRYATHCLFENPYDEECERLCGRVEPPEASAEIGAAIRALAAAWVLRCTGAQPSAWDAVEVLLDDPQFVEPLR